MPEILPARPPVPEPAAPQAAERAVPARACGRYRKWSAAALAPVAPARACGRCPTFAAVAAAHAAAVVAAAVVRVRAAPAARWPRGPHLRPRNWRESPTAAPAGAAE